MKLPKQPAAGEVIDWKWGVEVVQYLRALTPSRSATVLPKMIANGTTYEALVSPPLPKFTTFPFQLLDASTTEGKKIRVVYGTVNGTEADGMSTGDNPPYVTAISGASGYVYVEVTTDDDDTINDVSIGVRDTIPDDDDGDYHFQIGSYSVTGGTLFIAQAITGSLSFELCGGVEPLWGPSSS